MARGCTDADAELIIQTIMDTPMSVRQAALKIGCDVFNTYSKLKSDKYAAKYQIVQQILADGYDDSARQAIEDIQDDDTSARVARQKELAQYHMRMAGVVNHHKYGKTATVTHQTVNNAALLDAADQLRIINEQRSSICIQQSDCQDSNVATGNDADGQV